MPPHLADAGDTEWDRTLMEPLGRVRRKDFEPILPQHARDGVQIVDLVAVSQSRISFGLRAFRFSPPWERFDVLKQTSSATVQTVHLILHVQVAIVISRCTPHFGNGC